MYAAFPIPPRAPQGRLSAVKLRALALSRSLASADGVQGEEADYCPTTGLWPQAVIGA
jgi:hypothetical protein